MTINSFMTREHRKCDDKFAELENSIDKGNFVAGELLFADFKADMLLHFKQEEDVMFKEFNDCSGGGCNPTSVMIAEHQQMKQTLSQMQEALESKKSERFLGLCENLQFIMQQHNMKEEQIMYNMADNVLDSDKIIEEMKLVCP